MFESQDINQSQMLCLNVSPDIQDKAWQQAQNQSNTIARYNAFLNYLCTFTLFDWFLDWATDNSCSQPVIESNLENLQSFWEFVNGAVIKLGAVRLVIIPFNEAEIEKFYVPQEWVDIPGWVGDYYIAVQADLDADLEDCSLQVWGFTTHQQLKTKGIFRECDRTYSLPYEDLVKNLNLLLFSLGLDFKVEVPKLPSLRTSEAYRLFKTLSQPSLYSPRLQIEIPFEEWAGILESETYRKQLYACRIGQLDLNSLFALDPSLSPVKNQVEAQITKPIQLRKWLQKQLDNGIDVINEIWQSWEVLLVQPEAVRSRSQSEPNTSEAITSIIRLLNPQQPNQIRRQAAGVLGEIAVGNPQAIEALIQLLESDLDEETRWQASLSLGKIDPGNPLASVQKARLIDLGMQFANQTIGLIVSIMPKSNDKISVYLQIQPQTDGERLPPNLKLAVFSESGELIPGLETYARAEEKSFASHEFGQGKDQVLKLRFSPPSGTRFQVCVSLDDRTVTEDFIA